MSTLRVNCNLEIVDCLFNCNQTDIKKRYMDDSDECKILKKNFEDIIEFNYFSGIAAKVDC